MHHYRMYFAVVLAVVLSSAEVGRSFRIIDPRFQYAHEEKTKEAARMKGKSSGLVLTETLMGDNNCTKPDLVPVPEEGMGVDQIDPRQIYLGPSSYPLFYSANSEHVLPVENSLPEAFQTGDPYNPYEYHPSVQSFPTSHPYILEDIRYMPAYQEPAYQEPYNFIHPGLPMNTPIPYSSTTFSNHVPSETIVTTNTPVKMDIVNLNNGTNDSENELAPTEAARPITNAGPPSAIEDYMVRRILEIVDGLRNSNVTMNGNETYSPRKNMSIVATTSVNQNNTTRVESTFGIDETKTEVHSPIEKQIHSTIPSTTTSTTIGPNRYLVEQFVDRNGNPCMKELVRTSQKKSYYVYTCEMKSVPKTTTTSDVLVFRDELQMKIDSNTTGETKKNDPETTTPMTDDQTLPSTLNDYAIFNMQE